MRAADSICRTVLFCGDRDLGVNIWWNLWNDPGFAARLKYARGGSLLFGGSRRETEERVSAERFAYKRAAGTHPPLTEGSIKPLSHATLDQSVT